MVREIPVEQEGVIKRWTWFVMNTQAWMSTLNREAPSNNQWANALKSDSDAKHACRLFPLWMTCTGKPAGQFRVSRGMQAA